MKSRYLVFVMLAILVAGIFAVFQHTQVPAVQTTTLPTVQLDGQTIRVAVADTEAAREQGLSGRAGLAADEGMLFVFPTDGKYTFWMKDMKFSIDMIWISADGRVVYIAPNVSPDTYPDETFVSPEPARYVLELPANYSAQHAVKIGDMVQR